MCEEGLRAAVQDAPVPLTLDIGRSKLEGYFPDNFLCLPVDQLHLLIEGIFSGARARKEHEAIPEALAMIVHLPFGPPPC